MGINISPDAEVLLLNPSVWLGSEGRGKGNNLFVCVADFRFRVDYSRKNTKSIIICNQINPRSLNYRMAEVGTLKDGYSLEKIYSRMKDVVRMNRYSTGNIYSDKLTFQLLCEIANFSKPYETVLPELDIKEVADFIRKKVRDTGNNQGSGDANGGLKDENKAWDKEFAISEYSMKYGDYERFKVERETLVDFEWDFKNELEEDDLDHMFSPFGPYKNTVGEVKVGTGSSGNEVRMCCGFTDISKFVLGHTKKKTPRVKFGNSLLKDSQFKATSSIEETPLCVSNAIHPLSIQGMLNAEDSNLEGVKFHILYEASNVQDLIQVKRVDGKDEEIEGEEDEAENEGGGKIKEEEEDGEQEDDKVAKYLREMMESNKTDDEVAKVAVKWKDKRDAFGAGLLHYAASFDRVELIKLLISKFEYNVNDTDNFGNSIAHYADYHKSKKVYIFCIQVEEFEFNRNLFFGMPGWNFPKLEFVPEDHVDLELSCSFCSDEMGSKVNVSLKGGDVHIQHDCNGFSAKVKFCQEFTSLNDVRTYCNKQDNRKRCNVEREGIKLWIMDSKTGKKVKITRKGILRRNQVVFY